MNGIALVFIERTTQQTKTNDIFYPLKLSSFLFDSFSLCAMHAPYSLNSLFANAFLRLEGCCCMPVAQHQIKQKPVLCNQALDATLHQMNWVWSWFHLMPPSIFRLWFPDNLDTLALAIYHLNYGMVLMLLLSSRQAKQLPFCGAHNLWGGILIKLTLLHEETASNIQAISKHNEQFCIRNNYSTLNGIQWDQLRRQENVTKPMNQWISSILLSFSLFLVLSWNRMNYRLSLIGCNFLLNRYFYSIEKETNHSSISLTSFILKMYRNSEQNFSIFYVELGSLFYFM